MDDKPKLETNNGQFQVTRRRLIGYLLGFSVLSTLGGVLTPIIGYLWPSSQLTSSGGGRVLVGATADFPPGQGKVVPVNDQPVMIVNTEQGGLKAFSAVCTHLACITYWDDKRQVIQCPCHDGRFNPLNGTVIFGPPPRPLSPYDLEIVAGQVYVGEAKEVINRA